MKFTLNKEAVKGINLLKKFGNKKDEEVFAEFSEEGVGFFIEQIVHEKKMEQMKITDGTDEISEDDEISETTTTSISTSAKMVRAYLDIKTNVQEPSDIIYRMPISAILKIADNSAGDLLFQWVEEDGIRWLKVETVEGAVFNLNTAQISDPAIMPDKDDYTFQGVLNLFNIKPLINVKNEKNDSRHHPLVFADNNGFTSNGTILQGMSVKFPDCRVCKETLSKFPKKADISIFIDSEGNQRYKYQHLKDDFIAWELEVFDFSGFFDGYSEKIGELLEPYINQTGFKIPVKILSDGLKKLQVIMKNYQGCTLKFDGESLDGIAVDPDIGEAKYIPIFKGSGSPFEITVSQKKLLDILKSMSEGKIFLTIDNLKLFIKESGSHYCLLMGMKV